MKSRFFILSFSIVFVCSCNAQRSAIESQKIPNGNWVCIQDSLTSMIIKDEYVISYYDSKLVDTTTYILTNQPCDTLYQSVNKQSPLFLIWNDGICSEVEYLTDNDLMLIYTANGKLTTFHRKE